MLMGTYISTSREMETVDNVVGHCCDTWISLGLIYILLRADGKRDINFLPVIDRIIVHGSGLQEASVHDCNL